MFKTFTAKETKNLNHSGRSLVGETLQIEGDLRSSGSVDVAGLVNGNVFVSEMVITETGSIRGTLEAGWRWSGGAIHVLARSCRAIEDTSGAKEPK